MMNYNVGRLLEDGKTFQIFAESRQQATANHIAYMYNKAYEATGQDIRLTVLTDYELCAKYSHTYLED